MNDEKKQVNPIELRRKSVVGLAWLATERGAIHVVALTTFMILARYLEPVEFGRFAIAITCLALMELLVGCGIVEAIVQRKNLESRHLDSAFWFAITAGTLLSASFAFSAPALASLFQEPLLGEIVPALSVLLLFWGLATVQRATLRRNLRFRELALADSMSHITGGIVAVILAISGFGVWSLVFQSITARLLMVVLLWIFSDWRPRFRFSLPHCRDLIDFGAKVVETRLMVFLDYNSAPFIIGYFLNSVALGYYSLAFKVYLTVFNLLIQATQTVAKSVFPRIQDELRRLRPLYYRAVGTLSLVVCPICLGIAATAPELIRVLLGDGWLDAVPAIRLLMYTAVLITAVSYNGPILIALGRPSWLLSLVSLRTVTGILMSCAVVHWGIVWVAASFFVANLLTVPLSFIAVHRAMRIEWKPLLRHLLPPILVSTAMILSVVLLKRTALDHLSPAYSLLCSAGFGTVVYLILTRVLMKRQMLSLLDLVNEIRGKIRKGNSY